MPISSYQANINPNETANSLSLDLFSSGNIDVTGSVKIGDMAGALLLGWVGYIFLVLFFFIGVASLGKFYTTQSGGSEAVDGMNLFRVLLKPLAWVIGGVMTFVMGTGFVEWWYDVDIDNRMKFFFEARYDTMVSNLVYSAKMEEFAKNMLTILDLSSKFVFWSIWLIFLAIFLMVMGYIFTILLSHYENGALFKKLFHSFFVATVSSFLIGFYSSLIDSHMFKSRPDIPHINVVSSISEANTRVLKYFARVALGIE